ncbi:c-di-GMP phosphodiesterase A [Xanthomonas translucens pv. graminis]|uniref:C-di-GMP phosphodiesterase A n=3 Tax=Xanthomonas translucens group TaxID=3390202 RepID=A0A1M4JEH1_9XANT|nr:Signaling protein ykoW [Xanthomonas translucens pv. graminis ART-Xtg29]SBV39168.1 c-di-GMP phosphodiesterase A [Xanthomonas translucens pv. graminis]SBV39199.1 c-di-GMP phosphodiesterase A [Xanthomonas translucens pv. graminis]SBV45770.1 c-di-GMP phosphodiesterase A [Xanthomonas translucens pv. graminis ART-Xtg29]SBV53771.1 c-di-GMP phosphodiesterase A [Xanthomonas translucens pv. graminis]
MHAPAKASMAQRQDHITMRKVHGGRMKRAGTGRGSEDGVARRLPDQAQWPRIQRLLGFGGMACILHGLAWAAYYVAHGMNALALLLFSLMLLGTACLSMARKVDRFALVAIVHLLLGMTVFASLADTPTAAVPRSTHLFLLPIGAACFFLFRSEGGYLRWAFPALCFALMAALAIVPGNLGVPLQLMPDAIHRIGHALNTVTALALTAGVLAIFSEDIQLRLDEYAALVRALAHNELRVHLQPQVSARGRLIGAEVLLRWNRPGHGLQPPAELIRLAEDTGLIQQIGLWVLEQACLQLHTWARHPGTAQLLLSVNVSPLQLVSASFVQDVRAVVHRTGAPANRLRLEITESALAGDLALVTATMNALREDGISWSLDDFGTGFSSLSLLQALPLDELKIDRSFVRRMDADASQRALVRKIIEIAGVLGISTVAEGVETAQQHAWLGEMGCTAYQGYLFGRPVAAETFAQAHLGALVSPSDVSHWDADRSPAGQ